MSESINVNISSKKPINASISTETSIQVKVDKPVGQSIPPSEGLLVYDTDLQKWVELEELEVIGGTF